MGNTVETGKIGWIDITVDDATGLRDFYARVVGWKPEDVGMGDYSDFNMTMPGSGEPAAGICHARGGNAESSHVDRRKPLSRPSPIGSAVSGDVDARIGPPSIDWITCVETIS